MDPTLLLHPLDTLLALLLRWLCFLLFISILANFILALIFLPFLSLKQSHQHQDTVPKVRLSWRLWRREPSCAH